MMRNSQPRGLESSHHLKASRITQNELNNAVSGSPIDPGKFEVHRVRYQHPDPSRYESRGQDKEPYYGYNSIPEDVKTSQYDKLRQYREPKELQMHSESFRQLERKMSTDNLRMMNKIGSKKTLVKDRHAESHSNILEKESQRYHSQNRNIQSRNFMVNTPKNKIISASPASHFASAKDKASVHRNIIDSKRNKVNKIVNPSRPVYKVDLDDESLDKQKQARFQEDEDKLILEMLNRRKRVLFEDSELSINIPEQTMNPKIRQNNRVHRHKPSADMSHQKMVRKEWNRTGNYETFDARQSKNFLSNIIKFTKFPIIYF